MPNPHFAEQELISAKESLSLLNPYTKKDEEDMKFDDAEANWRNFLNHLDKSWIKTIKGCVDVEGLLQPIRSYVDQKRKIDPLLKYLSQARDADNHSIQILAGHQLTGRIALGYATVEHTDDFGNKSFSNIKIHEIEYSVMSFTNRGVTFAPPGYHLGKIITSKNPIIIGQIGISFYEEIIKKVKSKLQSYL